MTRQSISFTAPNSDWLNAQVESEEYSSKSDVVNDLIRKAHAEQSEIELIRTRIIHAEQSGFIDKTSSEILEDIKKKARRKGKL